MTRWKNPTAFPWRMTLHVEHGRGRRDPDNAAERPTPAVEHGIVIQPGEVVEIPSEFDSAIQRLRCTGPCNGQESFRCTDPAHAKEVASGLGIALVNLDRPAPLAPGFLDDLAEAEEWRAAQRDEQAKREETKARLATHSKGGAK